MRGYESSCASPCANTIQQHPVGGVIPFPLDSVGQHQRHAGDGGATQSPATNHHQSKCSLGVAIERQQGIDLFERARVASQHQLVGEVGAERAHHREQVIHE